MDAINDLSNDIDSLRRLMVRRTLERVLLYLPAAIMVELSLRILTSKYWYAAAGVPEIWLRNESWVAMWLFALIAASFFAAWKTLRFSAAAAAMALPLGLVTVAVGAIFAISVATQLSGLPRASLSFVATSAAWMYGLCKALPVLAGCEAELWIKVERREIRRELV